MKYCFRGTREKVLYEFRFNPMHDLESVWWIAIWTLLRDSPAGAGPTAAQGKMYSNVFHGEKNRLWVLAHDVDFEEIFETLLPSFNSYQTMRPMDELRSELMEGYRKATKSHRKFNTAPYEDGKLPSLFDEKLTEIVESLKKLVKSKRPPNMTFSKQQASTSEHLGNRESNGTPPRPLSGGERRRVKIH